MFVVCAWCQRASAALFPLPAIRTESLLVLGKSLNFGILLNPNPNPNPAFNRIRANPDPDPGSLGFVLDQWGFFTRYKNQQVHK
jgi:hypothetical protein